jgi:cell division transport system ATP-binding protein
VYDGGVIASRDVTLEIDKGEFVFLVGPSGSGKSTLIRLMLREEKPTRGDIWIAGRHVSEMPAWRVPGLRRLIGTVFQDYKLLKQKTVFENVAFALEVIGRPRYVINQQVPQVLKLVGLSAKADRYPSQLSGGEQQRVAIARSLASDPTLIVGDEPTGNLDTATAAGMFELLARLNGEGKTVLYVTHDRELAGRAQRVVTIRDGVVVAG